MKIISLEKLPAELLSEEFTDSAFTGTRDAHEHYNHVTRGLNGSICERFDKTTGRFPVKFYRSEKILAAVLAIDFRFRHGFNRHQTKNLYEVMRDHPDYRR